MLLLLMMLLLVLLVVLVVLVVLLVLLLLLMRLLPVVLVVGDVNSTIACALVAVKKGIPVIHVEAGLRSGDRQMPEEINRLVTDSIADVLWTPSPDADENLLAEGVSADSIDLIGNIMIDSFEMLRESQSKMMENMSAMNPMSQMPGFDALQAHP